MACSLFIFLKCVWRELSRLIDYWTLLPARAGCALRAGCCACPCGVLVRCRMVLASSKLPREGGMSGTRGIGGPRANTQYTEYAIGVMSSVIRASPRDTVDGPDTRPRPRSSHIVLDSKRGVLDCALRYPEDADIRMVSCGATASSTKGAPGSARAVQKQRLAASGAHPCGGSSVRPLQRTGSGAKRFLCYQQVMLFSTSTKQKTPC